MKSLYILINSPGEVSGWLKPAAKAICAAVQNINITAVTLPCPYASGMEAENAKRLQGVARAITYKEALKEREYIHKSVLLQLGGDPLFGKLISAYLRAPWLIYTARPKWRRSVSHYFIPGDVAKRRFVAANVDTSRYTVTGDLMLDSVPVRDDCDTDGFRREYKIGVRNILCFMLGSRPFEYGKSLPFFTACADALHKKFPDWQAIFPIAPTVDAKIIKDTALNAGLSIDESMNCITTKSGYKIPLIKTMQYDAISASSLAVAFPGTNNLQITALGVPLLSIAPLNYAHEIPLDGICGLIPLESSFMRAIKKKLVFYMNAKEKFVSLPNRLSDMEIVPERRELMSDESLVSYISEYIKDSNKRKNIADSYKYLNTEKGAAAKIAEYIAEIV
ncbi:MAG: hypothetical protein Q4E17_00890 [Synergistes sp.]|nr:hypothetical protein [Synergistes sp.]